MAEGWKYLGISVRICFSNSPVGWLTLINDKFFLARLDENMAVCAWYVVVCNLKESFQDIMFCS